jgi:hypothetical protein
MLHLIGYARPIVDELTELVTKINSDLARLAYDATRLRALLDKIDNTPTQ